MSKHTPGPWRNGAHDILEIRGLNKWVVARIMANLTNDDDDFEAVTSNARLIAAAPTMLEALKAAKGYMLNAKIDLQTGTKKETTLATIEGGIKNLEAAIALAEGE